jgi:hypothetical protein
MKTIGKKEGQFFPYLVHMGILFYMLGFKPTLDLNPPLWAAF